MKILFLSHYFPPEGNAPASRTHEHCKRWVAAGHQVTVVTCAPNVPDGVVYKGYRNKLYQRELVDGIEVVRLWTYLAPNKGFLKRIVNFLSYMFMATLYCCLFQRKVGVLVATSPQFFCGWAGVLCHWLWRWPFVLEIRDIWPESILTVGAMRKSAGIRFLERMELWMYRAADHIVAVGEGYKRKVAEKGVPEDKISVVVNGVSLADFVRVADTAAVRREYRGEGKFVCSYIGTVGMAHGLEVVLEAAAKLKALGDDRVIFWIVGDGARREALAADTARRSLDNVVFVGRVDKRRVPEFVSASDASLVHLRGTELFGTVIPSKIFELMALDSPIIMGVKGEARGFVLEAGAGVAMEPDNADDLLAQIARIRDGGRVFTGRAYVSEHFDRDRMAEAMLETLLRFSRPGAVG